MAIPTLICYGEKDRSMVIKGIKQKKITEKVKRKEQNIFNLSYSIISYYLFYFMVNIIKLLIYLTLNLIINIFHQICLCISNLKFDIIFLRFLHIFEII